MSAMILSAIGIAIIVVIIIIYLKFCKKKASIKKRRGKEEPIKEEDFGDVNLKENLI